MYGMRILLVPKYDADFIHKALQTRGVTIISVVSKMLTDLLERLGQRHIHLLYDAYYLAEDQRQNHY